MVGFGIFSDFLGDLDFLGPNIFSKRKKYMVPEKVGEG